MHGCWAANTLNQPLLHFCGDDGSERSGRSEVGDSGISGISEISGIIEVVVVMVVGKVSETSHTSAILLEYKRHSYQAASSCRGESALTRPPDSRYLQPPLACNQFHTVLQVEDCGFGKPIQQIGCS
jgi:hypothetical protein